jgi:hypothetical protein
LPPGEKKAQRLNPLKKGLLALRMKPQCSRGMVTPALVGLDLTLVARPVHPHLTLHHLTPFLQFILIMMKVKRAEKKMKTMSDAS